MRVIAGRYGGRRLQAPPGAATRPTSDRVREALFSVLGDRVAGARVLDLFAGSGALGLEALSRGAERAVFIETDRAALTAIAANVQALAAAGRASIRATDALRLPRDGPFDLILADPPYEAGSGTAVVAAVHAANWLAPGGWLAVETQRGDAVTVPDGWTVEATRDVGRARLTLIRR